MNKCVTNGTIMNTILTFKQINRVYDDGTIFFQDGDSIEADIILHCTGYELHPTLFTQKHAFYFKFYENTPQNSYLI